MNILSVKGLSKSYPGFELKDVSFDLSQGRIMGLIGKNGAGKSTTLKSVLGMVSPESGTVEMFGLNFSENEIFCRQNIGVVFGGTDFYSHKRLSAVTDVTKRFWENWDESSYKKYLDEFELDPKKRVRELSSGMKVKYLLAMALSHDARLFILDEPTSGLDPVSRDDLLGLFRLLTEGGRRSILFSTHIISDLEKCADDITYIKDGKLVRSAEKSLFAESFQHLKGPGEDKEISLEEIMIRSERKSYDI